MNLTKWLLAFSLTILLIPVKITEACSWWPESAQYRFSMFQPYVATASGYRPFYLTSEFLNDYQNKFGQKKDRERNIQEWVDYLKGKVPAQDIEAVLYKLSSSATAEALKGGYPKSEIIENNQFWSYLQRPENKAVLNYIAFAKNCEAVSADWNDPWEEEREVSPIPFLEQAEKHINEEKDKFLQLRYAFQYMRMLGYTYTDVGIDTVYQRQFARLKTGSIIKPWATFYHANYLYRTGKQVEACYLYAKVFWQCDEKKNACFNYFITDSAQKILALAKTTNDRADVLALIALEKPWRKLNEIKQLQAIAPNHPGLQLIITREINKCEDWLMTTRVNNFGSTIPVIRKPGENKSYSKEYKALSSDVAYANELLSYIEALAQQQPGNTFLNLAVAHLSLVLQNNGKALTYIQLAVNNQARADLSIQLQIQLTGLMIQGAIATNVNAVYESKVHTALKWLLSHPELPETEPVSKQFFSYLSFTYLQQGDYAKSALCRGLSQRFYYYPLLSQTWIDFADSTSINDFVLDYLSEVAKGPGAEGLVTLINKEKPTAFEELLTRPYRTNLNFKNELYDVTGTLYLRDDNLDKALSYFNKIPANYWREKNYWGNDKYHYLDANSFYAHPGDNHRHCKADTVKYSKPQFVKELIRLKQKVAKTNDAKTLVTIAHAYYNMTNYGNSWQLVQSFQSNVYIEDYTHYKENFYGCELAKAYYLKALQFTTNKEIQAECYAMLAECEKNKEFWTASLNNEDWYYSWDEKKKTFTLNSYFKKFLNDYKYTEYYKDAIAECGGIKEYVYAFKNWEN